MRGSSKLTTASYTADLEQDILDANEQAAEQQTIALPWLKEALGPDRLLQSQFGFGNKLAVFVGKKSSSPETNQFNSTSQKQQTLQFLEWNVLPPGRRQVRDMSSLFFRNLTSLVYKRRIFCLRLSSNPYGECQERIQQVLHIHSYLRSS